MTQTTDAALVEQTRLLHMGPNADGGWGMKLEGGPIPAIAEYLANMLGMRTDTPSNYVQMEVNCADLGAMILTLQRCAGKTPHQLRIEAEAKALAAADTIEAQARRIEALEGAAKLVARAVGVSVMPDGTHWAMLFPRNDPQPLLADIFAARAALEPTP